MAPEECLHGISKATCSICIEMARRKAAPGASFVPLAQIFRDPDEETESENTRGKENTRARSEGERSQIAVKTGVETDAEDDVPGEAEEMENMHDPDEALEELPEEELPEELKGEEFNLADEEEAGESEEEAEEPVEEEPPVKQEEKSAPQTKNIPEREPPSLLTEEEKLERQRLGETPPGTVIDIPINRIRPMSGQPRVYFDPVKLARLSRNIKKYGQRKPAEVKWLPDDPRYYCELIDGERRLLASEMAGRPVLRALISYVADWKQQYIYSVISNFGREGHTPIEIANAIVLMRSEGGLNDVDIADVFGKSVSWVWQHSKLAMLCPEVQAIMDLEPSKKSKNLKLPTALQLIYLPPELQVKLAHEVLDEGMSVLASVPYIRRRAKEEGYQPTDPHRSPRKDFKSVESSFRIMEDRINLILRMSLSELAAIFRNRDSFYFNQALAKSEKLSEKLNKLKENLLKIRHTIE